MRPNDQKYIPDTRSRSPGMPTGIDTNYMGKSPAYPAPERMTYSQTDYSRMNMGGGMPYQSSAGMSQNYYETEYKPPTSYVSAPPQPYTMPDYSSMMDSSIMFVPQSKYLQEEMKKTSYGKDFGYASSTSMKSSTADQSYQSMSIPQPQKYDMKPEIPK